MVFRTWAEQSVSSEVFFGELVAALAVNPEVRKVVLFGSYAYGKPGADSDVDIAVILAVEPRLECEKAVEVTRLLRGLRRHYEVPMDVLVFSESNYYGRVRDGFRFESMIERKGVVLYEQGAALGVSGVRAVGEGQSSGRYQVI